MEATSVNATIAENLRKLRIRHELTQDGIGQLLGLGGEVVARVEYGRRELRMAEAYTICAALQEPIDALLPPYPHGETIYDPGTAEGISREILAWMSKRDVRSIALFARRLAYEADRVLKGVDEAAPYTALAEA